MHNMPNRNSKTKEPEQLRPTYGLSPRLIPPQMNFTSKKQFILATYKC